MSSRRTGNVTGNSFRYRNVENFSTGSHGQTLSIRRQTYGCQVVSNMFLLRTGIHILTVQGDMNLFRLTSLRVQTIKITSMFINNGIAVRARELYVIIRIVRNLLGLSGFGVIDKQIHRHVTVGRKEDLIPDPHRENILSHVIRDIRYLLGFCIIDPDIIGHSSTIIFPATELTEYTVIGQLFPIWRIGTESTFGQRKRFRHSSFLAYPPKFPFKSVTDTVTVNNLFTIARPGHDNVIRPHTVTQVIAAVC